MKQFKNRVEEVAFCQGEEGLKELEKEYTLKLAWLETRLIAPKLKIWFTDLPLTERNSLIRRRRRAERRVLRAAKAIKRITQSRGKAVPCYDGLTVARWQLATSGVFK